MTFSDAAQPSVGVYPAPSTARPISDAQRDTVAGLRLVALLAVLGALLGLAWIGWSPERPSGFHQASGPTWIPDESEAAVASDGRYLVIAVAAGLLIGAAMWLRRRQRGPIAVVSMAVGCLVGAQLTRLVGYLFGGGSTSGPACVYYLPDPVSGQCIRHVKLSVHTPALFVVQAGIAVLVYGLCASFAVRDDLGRRDPMRLAALRQRAARAEQRLVGGAAEAQDAGGDRDGAGRPQ